MASDRKFSLPPVRNDRSGDQRGRPRDLPPLPERLPERPVAPNRVDPALSQGTDAALGELLIAIEPSDAKGLNLLLALIDHLIEYYKR